MKKLIYLTNIFILACVSFLAISCTDLSRNKAKQLLMEEDRSYLNIYKQLIFNGSLQAYEFFSNDEDYPKLINNGYITYSFSYWGIAECDLTSKIMPYLSSNKTSILLAEPDDIEITGITGSDNYRSVKYIIKYKPTAVGEILLTPERLTKEANASFIKYDDGWRLE